MDYPLWHGWLFLGSAAVGAFLTYCIKSFALTYKLGLHQPRERDQHTTPIPRLGGVAVTATFLLFVVGIAIYSPEVLRFVGGSSDGIDRNLVGIIVGALTLLAVGIYDDLKDLRAIYKLGWHFVAGVILVGSGVFIWHISNPFGGQLSLGLLMYPLVVLWVVFMVNAINWLDGLDGLSSGVSLIATIVLYLLAMKPEVSQTSMAVLAVILAGALVGFLPFNFAPAKIFLGDSGSQVLGFLLATFAIISGGKLATAFLVLGVPILDVVWVITRRFFAGKPIYQADRYHIHHRLLRAGLSPKQAVLLLYTVCAGFGIVALQTQSYGKFIAGLALVFIMIAGGLFLVAQATRRESKET
jgi:UDP-GlcNAc:undecaprenyl-phosphate/decaprenyl-phosphate GlcNAc-1-phosphate transferase